MILVAAQYGQLWQVRRTCSALASRPYPEQSQEKKRRASGINPLRIRKPMIITDLSAHSQQSKAHGQLS